MMFYESRHYALIGVFLAVLFEIIIILPHDFKYRFAFEILLQFGLEGTSDKEKLEFNYTYTTWNVQLEL